MCWWLAKRERRVYLFPVAKLDLISYNLFWAPFGKEAKALYPGLDSALLGSNRCKVQVFPTSGSILRIYLAEVSGEPHQAECRPLICQGATSLDESCNSVKIIIFHSNTNLQFHQLYVTQALLAFSGSLSLVYD